MTAEDPRRALWLLSPLVMLFPLAGAALVMATGWSGFWWGGAMLAFVVIPLLDHSIGVDRFNPDDAQVAALEKQPLYRWLVWLAVPLQYVTLFACMAELAEGSLPWHAALGLTVSLGLTSGVGVNTAHELGHKHGAVNHFFARLALAPAAYGHFFVEHNRGHHLRVATAEDPASSRYGESLWAFFPRTMVGGFLSAWRLEKERLAKRKSGPWTWRNENLRALGLTALVWGAVLAVFGLKLLPALLLQAVIGAGLFEAVNYLEHYGLQRKKLENGRYEVCRPEHSWNSNHRVTNLFLYQLQRHSDHHANASRSYQSLRHFDDVPQLPSGYATMVLVALVPPLWFRVMNPRVLAHYGGDLTRANVR